MTKIGCFCEFCGFDPASGGHCPVGAGNRALDRTMGATLIDQFTWYFLTYPIDAVAAAFGKFEPIVDLWRRRHTPSGGLPAWGDFDLMDFEGWWGQLALAEIDRTSDDVKFVLWGTKLADWWGEDFTQRKMIENSVLREPSYADQVEYYRAMSTGNLIGYNYGRVEDRLGMPAHAIWIDLPLSRTHDRPTHIFSVTDVVDGEDIVPPSIAV